MEKFRNNPEEFKRMHLARYEAFLQKITATKVGNFFYKGIVSYPIHDNIEDWDKISDFEYKSRRAESVGKDISVYDTTFSDALDEITQVVENNKKALDGKSAKEI